MVFKINKGYTPASIGGLLDYHEDKLEKGHAEKDYLFSTISMKNAAVIEKTLVQHMQYHNPRVYKNYFTQITANFNREDNLDDRTKREIVDSYLTRMGYVNTPMVAYRHFDKDHDHWHLISTASDFDGKRIDIRNDHHKSNLISRNIEKIYNLKVLNDISDEQSVSEKKLSEEKYKIFRACKKLISQENHTEFSNSKEIKQCIKPLSNIILDKPLTNDSLRKKYISSSNEHQFQILIRLLETQGLLKKSALEKIKNHALRVKKESRSLNEFLRKFNSKDEGFYARYVQADKRISYGCDGYYVNKPKIMGKGFQRAELIDYFENKSKGIEPQINPDKKEFSFDDVKKYVRASVQKASSISTSWEQFTQLLSSKFEVNTTLKRNSSGKASISFDHKEFTVKSSAIGATYKPLISKLNTNKNVQIELIKFKERFKNDNKIADDNTRPTGLIAQVVENLNSNKELKNHIKSKYSKLSFVLGLIMSETMNGSSDQDITKKIDKKGKTKDFIQLLKILDHYGLFEDVPNQQNLKYQPKDKSKIKQYVIDSFNRVSTFARNFDEAKTILKDLYGIDLSIMEKSVMKVVTLTCQKQNISTCSKHELVKLLRTNNTVDKQLSEISGIKTQSAIKGKHIPQKAISKALNKIASIMDRDAFEAEVERERKYNQGLSR